VEEMTKEELERDLRILEIQHRDGGMPWVEYERKKRQLEKELDSLREDTYKGSKFDSTKGK